MSAPLIAQAADGTIHFEGSVIAPTCVLTNGPAPADIRVRRPAVAVSALSATGQVVGRTPFIIHVTGNVELQLPNADHLQVLLSNPLGLQNTQSVVVESGGAALGYYAQYVAAGVATAGTANSSLTFTVIYR